MNVTIHSMNVGPTFVRVHWQTPSFRGTPGVSRYVITVTQANGTANTLTFFTNNDTRDFNVTGLAPGTMYEFRVAAISEYEMIIGYSLQSDPEFVDTATTGTYMYSTDCYWQFLFIIDLQSVIDTLKLHVNNHSITSLLVQIIP